MEKDGNYNVRAAFSFTLLLYYACAWVRKDAESVEGGRSPAAVSATFAANITPTHSFDAIKCWLFPVTATECKQTLVNNNRHIKALQKFMYAKV